MNRMWQVHDSRDVDELRINRQYINAETIASIELDLDEVDDEATITLTLLTGDAFSQSFDSQQAGVDECERWLTRIERASGTGV